MSNMLSYRFLLKPKAKQHRALNSLLETQRLLYNEVLAWKQHIWEVYKIGVSLYELHAWMTKQERFKHLPCNLKRATLNRADAAFQAFFRRCKAGKAPGYPRFKSADRYKSFGFNEFCGVRLVGSRLHSKAWPGGIRVNLHRKLSGKPKACSIKKEGARWYVCLQTASPEKNCIGHAVNPIGIDVGLKSLATLSNGEKIDNARFTRKHEVNLRIIQRSLSRCHRGSAGRIKVKAKLARAHEKIADCRNTYLHQASAKLVRKFDFFAVENLNVARMVRSTFAKSILDASWTTLLTYLTYKAENAGKRVVSVDPRGTSQTCLCGASVPKKLSDRVHSCSSCGITEDRDVHSAKVILQRAVDGPRKPNVAADRKRASRNIHL